MQSEQTTHQPHTSYPSQVKGTSKNRLLAEEAEINRDFLNGVSPRVIRERARDWNKRAAAYLEAQR